MVALIEQTDPIVGISDPNPVPLPGGSANPVASTDPTSAPAPDPVAPGPSLEDLYPTDPGIQEVVQPDQAVVTETDKSAADVGVPGVGEANLGVLSEASGIDAEQSILSSDQLVDQDLVRIMGQDSPLMKRAAQQSYQDSNKRGLQNSSIAIGAAQGAMVDRMLPMAQQNAGQAFQRAQENTALRQDASKFTAAEQNDMDKLAAQLGTEASLFNADQLNQGARLQAQMRVALEQDDAAAYNAAARQWTDLGFEASAENAAAQNARDAQIIAAITTLNEQFLQGTQAIDIADIQGQWGLTISQNETAGAMYNSFMDGIFAMMTDRKMTPEQIASAIRIGQEILTNGLQFITDLMAIDFTDQGGGGAGDAGGGGGAPGPTVPFDNTGGGRPNPGGTVDMLP